MRGLRVFLFFGTCAFVFAQPYAAYGQIDFSPLRAEGFGKAPKQTRVQTSSEPSAPNRDRPPARSAPSAAPEIRKMNELRRSAQADLSSRLAPVAATVPGLWIVSRGATNHLFGNASGPTVGFFIPTGRTRGTSVSLEGVQRAASIMALTYGQVSDEDAAFLADQAAAALEGSPLRINIVSLPSRSLSSEPVQELAKLAEQTLQLRNDIDSSRLAQREARQQINSLKKSNTAASGNSSDYMRKLNDIREVLASRAEAEENAKAKLKVVGERMNSYFRSWNEEPPATKKPKGK